jgi:hypothetical protein
MQQNNFPCVSIGSGRGSIERRLEDGRDIIICVDPNPTSYQRVSRTFPDKPPKYKDVHELKAAEPNLIGQCNILLNWPNPDKEGRFDLESILLLHPRRVLLVIDTTGGSGSDELLCWLQSLPSFKKNFEIKPSRDFRGEFGWINECDNPPLPSYRVSESSFYAVAGNSSFSDAVYRYVLLVRNDDTEYPDDYVPKMKKCVGFDEQGDEDGCSIM